MKKTIPARVVEPREVERDRPVSSSLRARVQPATPPTTSSTTTPRFPGLTPAEAGILAGGLARYEAATAEARATMTPGERRTHALLEALLKSQHVTVPPLVAKKDVLTVEERALEAKAWGVVNKGMGEA